MRRDVARGDAVVRNTHSEIHLDTCFFLFSYPRGVALFADWVDDPPCAAGFSPSRFDG